MTIDEKDFIRFITVRKRLSAGSVKICITRLHLIRSWFSDKEFTGENVEGFFFELRDSRKNPTLNTYRFTLRHIEDYLFERGILKDKFLEDFKEFPETRPPINILTPDEIERILAVDLTYGRFRMITQEDATKKLNFTHKALCMFLAYTGCRFDEAVSLKVKFIDLSTGRVTFTETKNKENRYAYITEPLISTIKTLMFNKKDDDIIFTSLLGAKVHATDFGNDLKKRATAAGVTKRVYPHLFRHSFATQLLISGVDITMVASLLGHKDIQTTYENYVHLADETLKRATHRHPLVRKNIQPSEILRTVKETLENFQLEEDRRFIYKIIEGSDKLSFDITVK